MFIPKIGVYDIKHSVFNQGGHATAEGQVEIFKDADFICAGAAEFLTDCTDRTWKLAPQAGSLWVGPPDASTTWWAIGGTAATDRPCAYDDEWTFNSEGDMIYDTQGDIWAETYMGVATDGCQPESVLTGPKAAWASGTHGFEIIPGGGPNGEDQIKVNGMGAFIGLRISKRRDEVAFGEKLAGWVFESPMTGYTEIFEETCRLLRVPRFLRPVLLRKTIRHVNAINQRPQPLYQLLEADMPLWGMPKEPLLLVQAQPDERLGNAHHQRLESTMQEAGVEHLLSAYYLESLRHSGAAVHDERDRLVSQWIDVHSSSE